jgi:energy-coupling factor transporter ATP-binding protein EcfA2
MTFYPQILVQNMQFNQEGASTSMYRTFNTNGYCNPKLHYMVDLSSRLNDIKSMIDDGKYFTITRARQFGKTTILTALADFLSEDYEVISLDFQAISSADFESEQRFVAAFSNEFLFSAKHMHPEIQENLERYTSDPSQRATLSVLFRTLSQMCRISDKKIVLIIDEADSTANNQVFIDFLAQLRAYYLKRMKISVFQSVILAGVYDIRNIPRKIRPEEKHKENSPWNIAADFLVDMSFSSEEIADMLQDYQSDHHTEMDLCQMAQLLYDYTSGYPYLVSRLCMFMDERVAEHAWTKEGFLSAVKMLLEDDNPLFQSLMNKLNDFPELNHVISQLLFQGKSIAYNADDPAVQNAKMFGFVKIINSNVLLANRIFEMRLYNKLLLDFKEQNNEIFTESMRHKNQFVIDGHLDVRRILEKFVEVFDYLFGDEHESFLEDTGRKYFMLFLRPIINGTGNCYVEARTRNQERMDLVIDYLGEQSIIEMKVWHGNAYLERGEEQLAAYLDYYHLKKGYLLSFNFNKKKDIGIKEIVFGDKLIIEAVV